MHCLKLRRKRPPPPPREGSLPHCVQTLWNRDGVGGQAPFQSLPVPGQSSTAPRILGHGLGMAGSAPFRGENTSGHASPSFPHRRLVRSVPLFSTSAVWNLLPPFHLDRGVTTAS